MLRTATILTLLIPLVACAPGKGDAGTDTDTDTDEWPWDDIAKEAIVFLSRHEGPIDSGPELYMLEKNGEIAMLINDSTAHYNPSISPDGTLVAFHRFTAPQVWTSAELFALDVASMTDVPLTDNNFPSFAPKWSPDGQRLVFSSMSNAGEPSPSGNIFVIDLVGGGPVQLTTDDDPDIQNNDPSWCGADRIVFKSTRESLTVDRDEIFAVAASGGEPFRLSLPNGASPGETDWRSDHDPRCSPDGSSVYFYRFEATRPWTDIADPELAAQIWDEIYPVDIWYTTITAAPGSETRLTDCEFSCNYPIPAADGSVGFLRQSFPSGESDPLSGVVSELMVMDPTGGNARLLMSPDLYTEHAFTLEYWDW